MTQLLDQNVMELSQILTVKEEQPMVYALVKMVSKQDCLQIMFAILIALLLEVNVLYQMTIVKKLQMKLAFV